MSVAHSLWRRLSLLMKPFQYCSQWFSGLVQYWGDCRKFRRLSTKSRNPSRFRLSTADFHPCLTDRTRTTEFDRHYVYHTSWAARILAETRPGKHIDISSSLYFCGLVSAFVPVEFYDYRPAELLLTGLSTAEGDATALPFPDRSVRSLSCMHVVEHIGLGRYGDPLDPDGDLKAMSEFQRVLAPGGDLLFVVPVGRSRICFNAHRIYSYRQVVEAFPELKLHRFALIPDSAQTGGLVEPATEELANAQEYGCGCFWFRRESGAQG